MSTVQTRLEEIREAPPRTRISAVPILLIAFSVFYFADVLLRASEKYFWYDELVTLYISRLDLHSIWQGLQSGADFNPFPFYLITKASRALFGENHLGMRMPEIIAFWIFCLCMFRIVNRRAGIVAGFIAMVLPLLTGAFYYAYEARPLALVLGFAGLSFVCWQEFKDGAPRRLWLTLFGLSLFGAFMSHCYAIVITFPFAAAELFETIKSRPLNYGIWISIAAPSAVAVLSYIPLLRAAHNGLGGTAFNSWRPPNWFQIPDYFHFLLGSCFIVILLAILLICLSRFSGPLRPVAIPSGELVVAIGFLALPALGVLVGKVANAPFFARYFLATLLGVCFLLPMAFAAPSPLRSRNWAGLIMATILVCLLGKSLCYLMWHRLHGWGESLIEPSSNVDLDTTPGDPLDKHSFLVTASRQSFPIAIRNPLEFLYVAHYSTSLAQRLYFIDDSSSGFFYRGFRTLSGTGAKYNLPDTYSHFIDSHRDFYLYGAGDVISEVSDLLAKGWTLRSLQTSGNYNLAWLERSSALHE